MSKNQQFNSDYPFPSQSDTVNISDAFVVVPGGIGTVLERNG